MEKSGTAASRLEECVKGSGATYTEFADILGVTRKTLYNWLSGSSLPARRHRDAIHKLSGGAIDRNSWGQGNG